MSDEEPILEKNEKIKDVQGYEGLYSVTSLGRIWSWGNNRNISPKWIVAKKSKGGYLSVGLYKNKKRKDFKIHRLVAVAFLPNTDNKPFVNHKDFDVTNNNIDNLEWCTAKENTMYSVNKGRWENMVKNETWKKGVEIANAKETWKKAVSVAKSKQAWKKGNLRCRELQTYKIAQKFAKEANKKKVNLFLNDTIIGTFSSIKEAAFYAETNGFASANTLKALKHSRNCRLEFI